MIYYGLRHKPSNHFMHPVGRKWCHPTDLEEWVPVGKPCRLFERRVNAKHSLSWLKPTADYEIVSFNVTLTEKYL